MIRWFSFQQGRLATAKIANIRQQNNRAFAGIQFLTDTGEEVTTTVRASSSYAPGMDILITYQKDNPSKCSAGDARKFPAWQIVNFMTAGVLINLVAISLVFKWDLLIFSHWIIYLAILALFSLTILLQKYQQAELERRGIVVQGEVEHLSQNGGSMNLQLKYTTLQEQIIIDAKEHHNGNGGNIQVRYSIYEPYSPLLESEPTPADGSVITTVGKIIPMDGKAKAQLHYTLQPHTYTMNFTGKSEQTYEKGQHLRIAYNPKRPYQALVTLKPETISATSVQ